MVGSVFWKMSRREEDEVRELLMDFENESNRT